VPKFQLLALLFRISQGKTTTLIFLAAKLRANVTKNQVKFEFSGRSRKIDFSLFSPTYSPWVDVKCDMVFFSLETL